MQTISDAIDAARLLRACRALHARWQQMREGRDAWRAVAERAKRKCDEARRERDQAREAFYQSAQQANRLAAENEQLVASVNAAMRYHAACEAERARLAREVEVLVAERGLARRRADDLARDLERVADERDSAREAIARAVPPVGVSRAPGSFCACGRRVSDCDGSRAACGGRR